MTLVTLLGILIGAIMGIMGAGGGILAVPVLVAQARRTRTIVRENLAWAAVYNAACVPLAIAGFMPAWLAGIGMAASSLLVVMNSARLATVRALE